MDSPFTVFLGEDVPLKIINYMSAYYLSHSTKCKNELTIVTTESTDYFLS
jgi:hypothetical protein